MTFRTSTITRPWKSKADRPMKLLVIGSGGREHALAWKLPSRHASNMYSSRPATAAPHSWNAPRMSHSRILPRPADFVQREGVSLTRRRA